MFEPTKHSITIAAKAADAILALINSRPRSPTKDELVALLVSHLKPTHADAPARHRAEWDAVVAIYKAIAKDKTASDEDRDAADKRIDDCAWCIMAKPALELADIKLLAEICSWVHWGAEPVGPLLGGPICDEALAALLRAIWDMPPS
jgi:hypothetical protein